MEHKGTACVAVKLRSMLLSKSWSFRTHDWQQEYITPFEEYGGQVSHYYIILHMNIPQTSSVVTACVRVVTSKRVAHVIVVASTPVT